MKTIDSWDALRDYGIVAITGEACSLMYRILCDLTEEGKRIVERALSVEIESENWNSGSTDDTHVASIMLTPEMIVPLGVFALLESGCKEVWVTETCAIGVEPGDSAEAVETMKGSHKPRRRYAYKGLCKDRNQHQMNRLLSFSHTAPVTLLPANGSTIRSPSSVRNSTKNFTSFSGYRAGWAGMPRLRQRRR